MSRRNKGRRGSGRGRGRRGNSGRIPKQYVKPELKLGSVVKGRIFRIITSFGHYAKCHDNESEISMLCKQEEQDESGLEVGKDIYYLVTSIWNDENKGWLVNVSMKGVDWRNGKRITRKKESFIYAEQVGFYGLKYYHERKQLNEMMIVGKELEKMKRFLIKKEVNFEEFKSSRLSGLTKGEEVKLIEPCRYPEKCIIAYEKITGVQPDGKKIFVISRGILKKVLSGNKVEEKIILERVNHEGYKFIAMYTDKKQYEHTLAASGRMSNGILLEMAIISAIDDNNSVEEEDGEEEEENVAGVGAEKFKVPLSQDEFEDSYFQYSRLSVLSFEDSCFLVSGQIDGFCKGIVSDTPLELKLGKTRLTDSILNEGLFQAFTIGGRFFWARCEDGIFKIEEETVENRYLVRNDGIMKQLVKILKDFRASSREILMYEFTGSLFKLA